MDFHSKQGPKLGDILCASIKSRSHPLDQQGIYELSCSCNPQAKQVKHVHLLLHTHEPTRQRHYDQQTRYQDIRHIQACPPLHIRHCRLEPTYTEKSKNALRKNLLIRESLEIKRQGTSTGDHQRSSTVRQTERLGTDTIHKIKGH